MTTVNEDIDIAMEAIEKLKQDLISETQACFMYETRMEMTIRFGKIQLAKELLEKYFNESA